MKNLTFHWNDFVKKVRIYTNDNKEKSVNSMNIIWPTVEHFPSCKPLDLFDYFDINANTPQQIFFEFYLVDNMQVTLILEDRNKATSRSTY